MNFYITYRLPIGRQALRKSAQVLGSSAQFLRSGGK